MCILCSELGAPGGWDEAALSALPEAVRREVRRRRAAVTSAVGRASGVEVTRSVTGLGYAVADRKGKSELVSGLAELWGVVERMGNTGLDPLDEDFLQRVEGTSRG